MPYLPVGLVASLVRLAEVEVQLVSDSVAELLHDVQCPLAQSLTHWVEEHQDQVRLLPYRQTGRQTGKRRKST